MPSATATPRSSLRAQMRSGVVPRLHESPPVDLIPRAPGVPRIIATGVRDSSPPSSSWRERKRRTIKEEIVLFSIGLVVFLAALMGVTYLLYR